MPQSEDFAVQKILNCRGQFSSREYLIQWKGFTPQDSTWEPLSSLKNCDNLLKAYHEKNQPIIYKSKLKDTDDQDFNPISGKNNSKPIKRSRQTKKNGFIQSKQQNIELGYDFSKKAMQAKSSISPKLFEKRDIQVVDMFVDQSLQGKIVYLIREDGVLFYRDRVWVLERCKEALIKYYQSCIKVNDS